MQNISLLIHGPFAGNAYAEIFSKLKAWNCINLDIVMSVYANDLEKTESAVSKLEDAPKNIRYAVVKDLVNPGFFNINRQIVTVRAGLELIPENHFVIKLRNDQWVDFSFLERVLFYLNWMQDDSTKKILTTNCFTRVDRLYHPSDMFLCGWQPDLAEYYSAPLNPLTHVSCELEIVNQLKNGVPMEKAFVCPEIWLCRHYLEMHNWNLLFTREDSFAALKTFFHFVNSWEIELRWKKDRTPGKGEGAIILPQYMKMSPFPGVPEEEIKCYLRSDFEGEMTPEDERYLKESIAVWKQFEARMRRDQMASVKADDSRKVVLARRAFSFGLRTGKTVLMILPHFVYVGIKKMFYHPSMQNFLRGIKHRLER